MNNTGGAIHFEITASNDDLKRKLAESRQALLDSGRTAEEQGSKIESMFKRAAMGAGVFFSAQQALQFAKQVAVVRGEFQQLEVAFTTMLGSATKGKAMMREAVELAAKTPFDLKGVAQGAKQLLAYGSDAKVVTKELTMLGNVAAGLSIPLGDIVYLYGTTQTQGRLYTQDMRQFMGRGIPLAEELAKQFGVTKDQISKMVTEGKIGFPEVQKALQAMTSEGGKFNNLMEMQSKTITGQISNLGDAIDVMFNKMGQSQEGFISSVISGTTELVENYEAVGREIVALVVAYGAYKAAVISLAAIQKTVTTIKHTEEAAELVKLLTIEQQANISKLGLAKTSAEYAAAVKAEVMSEMERQTQLAVTTNAELEASRVRLASAEVSKKRAEEIVTAKKTELASITGTSKAEQISVVENKIAIESEKQSRSALEIVKLRGRKNDAIAQAQHLKEIGASAEKIAAKNREIAVIAEKITVQRAEEIQHSRNVVALRAEIAVATTSVKSKSVLKAQSALLTAQTQLETAATARNAAALELSSQRAIVDSAVRKANTIETGINTAIKNANAKSSAALFFANFKLSAVTSKLSIVTKQATAAITKNPYVVAAVAVAALTYGIYKLCTAQSAAERAQEAFNEKIKEGKKKQDEFVSKTNELIDVIRTETNTRYMQTKAFKKLNEMYPDLLKNMSMEKLLLMDNLELQKLLAHYTDNKDKKGMFDGLDDAQQKVEAAKKAYDDYAATGGNISILEVGRLKNKIYEAEEYLKQWQNKLKEHRQIEADARPVDEKIGDLSQNITLLKKQLSEVEKLQEDAKKNNPFESNLYEFKVGAINAQISAKQQELKALNDGNGTDVYRAKSQILTEIKAKTAEISALESKSSKSKKEIQELKKLREERKALESEFQDFTGQSLERKPKPTTTDSTKVFEARIEAERKLKEALVNMQFDTEQARIDVLADGLDKELAQIELNYTKKQTTIELWEREQRQIVVDAQKTAFIAQGGKEQDFKVDGSDPAFTSIGTSYDAKTAANNAERTASNEKLLTDLKAQWQTWADDYQKIEDQIAATRANADRDRRSIDEAYKAGKIDDKEAMAATQQVDEGEQNALNNLDEEIAKREVAFNQWVDGLIGMGLRELQNALQTAEATLNSGDSKLSEKEMAVLRAEIAALKKQIKVEEAKNPAQRAAEKAKKQWGETIKVMNGVQETVGNIVNSFEGLDDATKHSLTAATNIAGGIIGMIFGIQSLAMAGAEAVKSVEDASVILAIIGAAVQIITAIFNLAGAAEKRHQEALAEIHRNKVAMQREYNQLLFEQNLLLKEATSVFGVDEITKAINAFEQYRDQLTKYKEELKGTMPTMKFFDHLTDGAFSSYDQRLKDYQNGIGALNDITIKTGHEKTGLFGWGEGRDIYTSISKIYPDIINKEGKLNVERAKAILATQTMSDENKALLESLIKMQENAEGAMDVLNSYLESTFGEELGGGIMDAVTDGIMNGTDAWKEFGKTGASVLEKLGEQIAYELFFSKKFKYLQEQLTDIYGSDKTPTQIAKDARDAVADFYNGIGSDMQNAENWLKQWQDEAAKQGLDLWKGEQDETSLSGQIRGTVATEQSVSELGGMFRGMADTGRRIEIGLDLGFKTVAEMARTQLLIEANTRRSADNTDGLIGKIEATNTKIDTLISNTKPDNGSY